MKASILASACVLLLVAVSGCTSTKTAKNQTTVPATDTVYLTGSYIKQPITRNGLVTDGPSQVLVIDRKAIETSGAADVRGVMLRYGYPSRR